jgi:hypothetical protein
LRRRRTCPADPFRRRRRGQHGCCVPVPGFHHLRKTETDARFDHAHVLAGHGQHIHGITLGLQRNNIASIEVRGCLRISRLQLRDRCGAGFLDEQLRIELARRCASRIGHARQSIEVAPRDSV